MSKYNWGKFWGLVAEAHAAGQDVDDHDLRTGIESHKEWVELLKEQAATTKELIEYIVANHESLLYAGRESVADATALLADEGGDPTPYFSGQGQMNPPLELKQRGEITDAAIRIKLEHAKLNRGLPRAEKVDSHPDLGVLVVTLTNQQRLVLPAENLQGLEKASLAQLENYELAGGGTRIRFPDLSADFWVPGLVRGIYGSRRWMINLQKRLRSLPES